MKDEHIGIAGWLLADLVLILAVIFLAMVPGQDARRLPLTLVTAVGPGTLGLPYSADLVARGGGAGYRYALEGTLPPGLTLDPDSGALTGTPTSDGTFNLTATVRDSTGATATSSVPLTISASSCLPQANFQFDQIVVSGVESTASWEQIAKGRVRANLSKKDDLKPATDFDWRLAADYLLERYRGGARIALIETFGWSPPNVVSLEVATRVNIAFMELFHRGILPREFVLNQQIDDSERWLVPYFADGIERGTARIDIFFVTQSCPAAPPKP